MASKHQINALEHQLNKLQGDSLVDVPSIAKLLEMEILRLKTMALTLKQDDACSDEDGVKMIELVSEIFDLGDEVSVNVLKNRLVQELGVIKLLIPPVFDPVDKFVSGVTDRLLQKNPKDRFTENSKPERNPEQVSETQGQSSGATARQQIEKSQPPLIKGFNVTKPLDKIQGSKIGATAKQQVEKSQPRRIKGFNVLQPLNKIQNSNSGATARQQVEKSPPPLIKGFNVLQPLNKIQDSNSGATARQQVEKSLPPLIKGFNITQPLNKIQGSNSGATAMQQVEKSPPPQIDKKQGGQSQNNGVSPQQLDIGEMSMRLLYESDPHSMSPAKIRGLSSSSNSPPPPPDNKLPCKKPEIFIDYAIEVALDSPEGFEIDKVFEILRRLSDVISIDVEERNLVKLVNEKYEEVERKSISACSVLVHIDTA